MSQAPSTMTDSPWFWAYLFTMFGLIALAVISPKYTARQLQIERQYEGRQRAAKNVETYDAAREVSPPGGTRITLQPLFIALAAVTTVAWLIFWRTRHRSSASSKPQV